MSASRSMVCETADVLFKAVVAETDPGAAWARISDAGFPSLHVPEGADGFGGDWGDVFAVLRLAGNHGLAAPLAEAILAMSLLARAGIAAPDGRVGLGEAAWTGADIDGQGLRTGVLDRVPWGRDLDWVVTVLPGRVLLIDAREAQCEPGTNLAGEPRDRLAFTDASVTAGPLDVDLRALGAFSRVALMAGALDAGLAMAVDHVNERRQFGKPLSKLQAVQQSLAVAAMEAAAVNVAGQAAAEALDAGDAEWEVAAAKARANAAVGTACAILHQAHGAIGFTEEYPLQRLTRRLMSWRGEYGGDRYWTQRLGGLAARAGRTGLWAELTRRSDRLGERTHD